MPGPQGGANNLQSSQPSSLISGRLLSETIHEGEEDNQSSELGVRVPALGLNSGSYTGILTPDVLVTAAEMDQTS